MKRLEGKTAWVTGAGSGIGRAIAISFAAEGAKVALTGRRVEPLEETAKMIGGGAVIVPADLTDEKQVAAALAKVESSIGKPDGEFARIQHIVQYVGPSSGVPCPARTS